MTTGSPPRVPVESQTQGRGGRARGLLVSAACIEVILVVPQILIVAVLGEEAAQGLVWPVWFWTLVLSLVAAALALVGLVLTVVDVSAHRVTTGEAVGRIMAAVMLLLIAPFTIFVVPLLASIGFGRP